MRRDRQFKGSQTLMRWPQETSRVILQVHFEALFPPQSSVPLSTSQLGPSLGRSNMAREHGNRGGFKGWAFVMIQPARSCTPPRFGQASTASARPETKVVDKVTHLLSSPSETHRMLKAIHSSEPHRLGLSIALKMSSRRLEEVREN